MAIPRNAYPTDASDEEWASVATHLTLLREDAGQRRHALREVFMVRAGSGWRRLPHDVPPWAAVDQQVQRWLAAGVFAAPREPRRVRPPRAQRASARRVIAAMKAPFAAW